VDDSDVEVLDEHDDGGSSVGSADADMEEAAAMAEGELALGFDDIVADAAFDDDGSDDKTGLRHPADAGVSPDAYVLRDLMPMS
jgi:hypothetical protein